MGVSNEQLLKDINSTIKEMGAYDYLRKGFEILALLPENAGTQARKYYSEYNYYDNLYIKCLEFLNKLYGLAEDRGIEMEEEI